MCLAKSVSALPPPPQSPTPAELPRLTSQASQAAGDAERRRLRSASGRSSTILTGPQGLGNTASVAKTILGG